LRKIFNFDIIYMQKYMQVWRFNKNYINKEQSEFSKNKKKSIQMIETYFNKIKKNNLLDVIKRF